MVSQLRQIDSLTPKLTSDGPIECKGQGPCGIVAVLCIKECFILVQTEQGRVPVGCVSILILGAILGGGKTEVEEVEKSPVTP